MNILILPGAEGLLSKQEVDWIHQTVPGNEKVLGDAIDFAVNHPETYVGILMSQGLLRDTTKGIGNLISG